MIVTLDNAVHRKDPGARDRPALVVTHNAADGVCTLELHLDFRPARDRADMAGHVTCSSDNDVEPPGRLIRVDDLVSPLAVRLSLPGASRPTRGADPDRRAGQRLQIGRAEHDQRGFWFPRWSCVVIEQRGHFLNCTRATRLVGSVTSTRASAAHFNSTTIVALLMTRLRKSTLTKATSTLHIA